MAEEVELKLAMSPAAATRLAHADAFGPAIAHKDLRSTYFDTPGEALRKAGMALRVRSCGHRHVQTIKRGYGRSVLMRRGEWDKPVKGVEPVADPRSGIGEVLARAGEELAPTFTVTVHREVRNLVEQDACIEMAVDRGRIETAERSEDFCEVELELVHGDVSALFAIARKIDALTTVRLGEATKAGRGWRLLANKRDAVRAEDTKLTPAMSVEVAFAAIASSCVVHYRRNEDMLLEGPTVEALHQARVALRRLRSAIHAFRAILPGEEPRRLDARLRRLALALGSVRDLDVMIARAAPGMLRERMIATRETAWKRARRRLGARATRDLLLDTAEWLQCGAWREDPATLPEREEPVYLFAARVLTRLRRRVRRHGHHFGNLSEGQRHLVRKDVKKLRYNAEFFATLFDRKRQCKRRTPFFKALRVLQDDLGVLNDVREARAWLDAEGLAEAHEAKEWLEAIHKPRLLKHAADKRRKLLDAKPFWQ